MGMRTAVEAHKKTHIVPINSMLRRHTAVRPVSEYDALSGLQAPNMKRDFSQIRPQTTDDTCHTCPAQMQTKLTINKPGDKYEQEADRIADLVMRMPDPKTRLEEETTKRVQTTPLGVQRQAMSQTMPMTAPPIVHEVLSSQGRPLDAATRAFMEPRFGRDFSQVRVHTGPRSTASAKEMNALAYTAGQNMVFRSGHYSPYTSTGRHLLAHELMHVVQQRDTDMMTDMFQRKSDDPTNCGGVWTCAASPSCENPDAGRTGDGGIASSWTLKVMIDVEAPSAEEVSASTVGHTHVEFVDSTGRTYTYGFYPDKSSGTPDPMFKPVVKGCMVHPDTSHASCVDYTETFALTEDKFNEALSYAQTACKHPPSYNIQTWNCTTFAVEVAKKAGKSLPPVRGKLGRGMLSTIADNPNKMYEGLKRRDIGPTYNLTGDTEIRDVINGADVLTIVRIPTIEKLRIINRLLDGWVSDDDIMAIGKVYRNISTNEKITLKKAIEARLLDLTDIGQRTQVLVILVGG